MFWPARRFSPLASPGSGGVEPPSATHAQVELAILRSGNQPWQASVRSARVEDAAAVAAVGRVAFMQQYEGLVDPANYALAADRWYCTDAIAASIAACRAHPHAYFLVAERDEAVVGFLHYDEFGREPELHRIYLAASERGQGTGSLLMGALHARLPKTAEYILAVVEGNEGAIRFYRRHGLEVERRTSGKRYYRDTAGLELPNAAADFGLILMRFRRSSAEAASGST